MQEDKKILSHIMNEAVFENICQNLSESKDGLTEICKKNNFSRPTFFKFRDSNLKYADRYARARVDQWEYLLECLHELEQEMLQEVKTAPTGTAGAVASAYKLMVDNIKWALSKLRPGVYGEHIDVTTNNESINKVIYNFDGKSPEELRKIRDVLKEAKTNDNSNNA